jgi:hypothetical protein
MAINYTEKGAGLHDAIAAAGHWLAQIDGVWQSSDAAAVQAIIDDYTLDRAKDAKCRQVLAHAKALRDAVVAQASAGEMASWPIKRAEALRYGTEGGSGNYPLLSQEATERGITLAALVAKVNVNAARFSMAEAAIGGADGRHRDAIMALPDFDAVARYDFSIGWPEV